MTSITSSKSSLRLCLLVHFENDSRFIKTICYNSDKFSLIERITISADTRTLHECVYKTSAFMIKQNYSSVVKPLKQFTFIISQLTDIFRYTKNEILTKLSWINLRHYSKCSQFLTFVGKSAIWDTNLSISLSKFSDGNTLVTRPQACASQAVSFWLNSIISQACKTIQCSFFRNPKS